MGWPARLRAGLLPAALVALLVGPAAQAAQPGKAPPTDGKTQPRRVKLTDRAFYSSPERLEQAVQWAKHHLNGPGRRHVSAAERVERVAKVAQEVLEASASGKLELALEPAQRVRLARQLQHVLDRVELELRGGWAASPSATNWAVTPHFLGDALRRIAPEDADHRLLLLERLVSSRHRDRTMNYDRVPRLVEDLLARVDVPDGATEKQLQHRAQQILQKAAPIAFSMDVAQALLTIRAAEKGLRPGSIERRSHAWASEARNTLRSSGDLVAPEVRGSDAKLVARVQTERMRLLTRWLDAVVSEVQLSKAAAKGPLTGLHLRAAVRNLDEVLAERVVRDTAWTPQATAARRKTQAVRRALLSRFTEQSTAQLAVARAKAAQGDAFQELWALAEPFVGLAYHDSYARLPAEHEKPWVSLLRTSLLKLVAKRTTDTTALLRAVKEATEQGRPLEPELRERVRNLISNGGLAEKGVYDLSRVDIDVAIANERFTALVEKLRSANEAYWVKVELPRTRAK
ncbi:MAG: hypothetical protein IT371_25600 [Deltaproteobacteria bacterium]|nr:hypothetical protein [Deltaproteobacteria bacterium]